MKDIYRRIKSSEYLPSLPHVLLELLEATRDEKKSSDDLAKIIQKDPSLTGYLLKVVNSPLYGLSRKVVSLSQAITILGWKAVQNVGLTASVFRTFQSAKTRGAFNVTHFWWHSLACTFAIKHLSTKFGFANADEAFVAGLLHDIGKLVLSQNFPDDYDLVLKTHSQGGDLCSIEESVFGANHAEVGGWLLESWNLQPFLVDAVRYHHEDLNRVISALPLVQLTYLADVLSNAILEEDDQLFYGKVQGICEAFELFLPDIEELREKMTKDVNDFAECLGIAAQTPSGSKPPSSILYRHVEDLSQKKQLELCSAVKDIAQLLGLLRGLLEARNSDEVITIVLEGLCVLFSFESAILMLLENDGKELVGKRAFGTKQDGLAGQIIINRSKIGSIWHHALTTGEISHSELYFKDNPYTIFDKQIANFLGKETFTVIPLSFANEVMGVGVITASTILSGSQENLLQTFSAHAACSLRTHKAMRRLAESEELNRAMVEHAPIGLVCLDENEHIKYLNPVIRNIFEISPQDDVAGLSLTTFGLNTNLKEGFSPVLSKGSQGIPRFQYYSPSGKKYWLSGWVVSLDQKSSLMFLEDVTERVRAEETRNNYAALLERGIKEKTQALEESQALLLRSERIAATGRLARKIAHEVSNPLGIIRNYLQIIAVKMKEDDPHKTSIRIIDEEIERIAQIIRELSSVNRLTPDKVQYVDINRLLKDLVTIMHESYERQGIKVILDLSEKSVCASVDRDKLKQVFINLIKNAGEAMPNGGEIRLSTNTVEKNNKSFVVVEVRDTGPGIPEEVLNSIFDPFYSTKGLSNSGLGLSVSYEIVKAFGGDILVDTSSERGTAFSVHIPVT